MSSYSYKENAADAAQIKRHFAGCDFEPKLETYVDIDAYVDKLLAKAQRFECWDDSELAGLAAVYCNDFDSLAAFVTMVSVMTKYTGQGIASRLLERVIDHCAGLGFKKLDLEVRPGNDAMKLYKKFGFRVSGESAGMIRMSKELAAQ